MNLIMGETQVMLSVAATSELIVFLFNQHVGNNNTQESFLRIQLFGALYYFHLKIGKKT